MNAHEGLCPVTKTRGKRVDTATVKCMLSVSLDAVRDTAYFFCREPDCDVIYFSDDGQQVFTKDDVRERVYQKEPENDEVLVCYCFRYQAGEIKNPANQNRIIEAINDGIKAGQCACDWRNPQGDCCLGNVKRLVDSRK
jgi:hypothetical protein